MKPLTKILENSPRNDWKRLYLDREDNMYIFCTSYLCLQISHFVRHEPKWQIYK